MSLCSLKLLFENLDILVPMDNFISRGTAHFLTCKKPDYQQSLYNVLTTVSISSDSNNAIICLCLLIVVRNCKVYGILIHIMKHRIFLYRLTEFSSSISIPIMVESFGL